MNHVNFVHLEGTLHGPCWTRWKCRGRGQVRFWLAVSRELAGDGYDLVLCAIEPKTGAEVFHLERELRDGRTCALQAHVRSLVDKDRPLQHQEDRSVVIFVAESCGLDGQSEANSHRLGAPQRRRRLQGKMAAANDDSGYELPLEVQS